jgi:hypothetical protein
MRKTLDYTYNNAFDYYTFNTDLLKLYSHHKIV